MCDLKKNFNLEFYVSDNSNDFDKENWRNSFVKELDEIRNERKNIAVSDLIGINLTFRNNRGELENRKIVLKGANLWFVGFAESIDGEIVIIEKNMPHGNEKVNPKNQSPNAQTKYQKYENYNDSDNFMFNRYEVADILSNLKKENMDLRNDDFRKAFICTIFICSEIVKNKALENVFLDSYINDKHDKFSNYINVCRNLNSLCEKVPKANRIRKDVKAYETIDRLD